MRLLVYGSANVDNCYKVDHIARINETISSCSFEVHPGGKGANQAVAAAKAGLEVYFAGRIGEDGILLGKYLEEAGVNTKYLKVGSGYTGKAIIQVDEAGGNSILLFSGENRNQSNEDIISTIGDFGKGDVLLLQNEVNGLDVMMREAKKRGMLVFFNFAPFDKSLFSLPLELCDGIIVNEVEGAGFIGSSSEDQAELIRALDWKRGRSNILLTLGSRGSVHISDQGILFQEALGKNVVDTTAAGDTFIGYFLASCSKGLDYAKALYYAAKASGIAISRVGAMESIPTEKEVFGD